MIKFQQLKRSKTLWAFNEWNMPWERDLLSINPNPGSLIKPSNTVSEYVDTRLQHFLIIFNSRHIFPFNWHSEMPLQSYQIGTKFSKEITAHFWILIHLIEIVILKLFLEIWKRLTPHFVRNSSNIKVIYLHLAHFLVHISCQWGSPEPGQSYETMATNPGLAWDDNHGVTHNTPFNQSQHQPPSFSHHLEPNTESQTATLK